MQRRELDATGSGATSRRSSATRPQHDAPLVPQPLRGLVRRRSARRRSCSAGSTWATGLTLARQDRPDRRRPVLRARDRPGLQGRQERALGDARSRRSCGSRSRSTCSCCATSSGSSRSAASTGRSPATASRAGCSAPRRRATCSPGYAKNDYLDDDAFWDAGRERARRRRARSRGRIRTGDVRHDPKGGECPRGATSGRCAG